MAGHGKLCGKENLEKDIIQEKPWKTTHFLEGWLWEIGWHNEAALANCEEIETRKRHVKKTAILLSFFSYSFACLELGPENKVSKPPRQFSLFCLYCFFFWLAQETCTHYICIIVIFACTFQFTFVEFTSKNNACCMVFLFLWATKNTFFLVVQWNLSYGIIHKDLDPWRKRKTSCMYTNTCFLHSGTQPKCVSHVFSVVLACFLILSTIRTENTLGCTKYCGCLSTGDQELKPQLFS